MTCPRIQLIPSIIWAWSDWTQAGRDWLCDWMAFVSVSPWWTVSGPGGQTSDPDGLSLMLSWCMPGPCMGCEAMWVSPGPYAVFRVSACLCLTLNTDINIQRSASCEPRVTAEIESLWPSWPDTRHRAPEAAGGRETVSVSGQWQCCVRWPRDVSRPLICHFIWTDIWSRQWHAGRQRDLILSTIYCYFKIF